MNIFTSQLTGFIKSQIHLEFLIYRLNFLGELRILKNTVLSSSVNDSITLREKDLVIYYNPDYFLPKTPVIKI